MKKDIFPDILYRLIYPTALYFTVVTLILYVGGTVMSYNNMNMIPTLRIILIVLAFSFIFNLANMVLTSKKLHLSLRIAIHYVATAVSFFVLFINASDYNPGNGFTIVLMLVYTLVYALICAVVLGVRSAHKKSEINSSEYHSIYDKRI